MTIYNQIILRDVEDCTGINLISGPKSIESALEIFGFQCYVPEPTRLALEVLVKNLRYVFNSYFIYDPIVHKEPIGVYNYLNDNWDKFMEDLTLHLKCEVLDSPHLFQVYDAVRYQFKDLPKKLLHLASFHKFDATFLKEELLGEDDQTEEEI